MSIGELTTNQKTSITMVINNKNSYSKNGEKCLINIGVI
jgi:hypothetical protein